jgi:MFS family permease
LLLAGGVSDDVGRRPVLRGALGALMASSVLFMVADSAAWLFVARGLQGLATGAALSAASAALLDLHPNRDPAGVGLTTATAAASGIGLGALDSSALVQLPARPRHGTGRGTLPRVLPYVVLFVLFAVALAGTYWIAGVAYLTLHLAVTAGVRPWLHRHRPDGFPFVRTALLLARGLARIGFLVFPTASPRLAGVDIVDTVSGRHVDLNRGVVSSLYNPPGAAGGCRGRHLPRDFEPELGCAQFELRDAT